MKARMVLYGSLAVSALLVAFACVKHAEGVSATKTGGGVTNPVARVDVEKAQAQRPIVTMSDNDPDVEARAAMLASLGFGTNGGHAVTVTYKQ